MQGLRLLGSLGAIERTSGMTTHSYVKLVIDGETVEVRELFHLVAAILRLKPREVVTQSGAPDSLYKNSYRTTSLSMTTRQNIALYLNNVLTTNDKLFIVSHIKGVNLAPPRYYFSAESLFENIDPLNISNTRFFQECCQEPHQDYLIIRPSDIDSVIISRMRMKRTDRSDLFASFVSIRPYLDREKGPGGRLRLKMVRGIAFSYADSVYTLAASRGAKAALRTTRLRIRTRENRSDLYGLRLGFDESAQKPFGHTVYAYQLKTHRPRSVISSLLCRKRWDDDALNAHISNLKEIRELLKPSGQSTPGVLRPQDFQE